jgi:hypothetical protein
LCDASIDLSALEARSVGAAVDGFAPVYFADLAPAFQVADPLLSNNFVSHTSSAPDPGKVYVENLALYDQYLNQQVQVPEPGTGLLFMVGLLVLMFRPLPSMRPIRAPAMLFRSA